MSKQIEARIPCPQCGEEFNVTLYRTLWIEDPINRNRVLNDEINVVICPACRKKTRVEFPFLCTNVKKGIAIWYEPYHDPVIDKDISQYAAHFGPNSFYAKAPRIQEWAEFKKRLLEMEATTEKSTDQISISPVMNEAFSGFVASLKQPASKQSKHYPWWLSHLRFPGKRFMYATLPFLLLLSIALLNNGSAVNNKGELISVFLVMTGGAYAFLTAAHLVAYEYKPWRERSKLFRLCIFLACCWLVGVIVFVMLFYPYGHDSWSYMNADDYLHLFSVALIPPAFIGIALYTYRKYVQ
jgi:hypothetical protein